MEFYSNVVQKGNQILVRGVKNGKRFLSKEPFSPRLFVRPGGKSTDTPYRTLSGEPAQEMCFSSINEARDFAKQYEDVTDFPIYGNTMWQYQYIAENYPGVIEYNNDLLEIYTVDIETATEEGFPQVSNPVEEVLLITVQNKVTKQFITWGSRPYTVKRPNHKYILCRSEQDLLLQFIKWFATVTPDIITGWNTGLFDIPYIIVRAYRILGEETVKELSPWRVVTAREINVQGRDMTTFDILGVSHLDYIDLYKKFTYSVQESYKLDHIAFVELGKRKLENPYPTYREFYTNDWELFVDYNIVDVELVDALEDKMRLIELIITMAYDAKCNFSDVFSSVRTWDCLLYNHCWNKGIVIPQKPANVNARSIEGAYVKEPVPGAYSWVVSFDAASLYPSIIMQYNMSPETLVPVFPVDTSVKELLEKKTNLSDLYAHNLCMTANGYRFKREKQGLFPEIVAKLFSERQMYKKKMLAELKEYEKDHNEEHKRLARRYDLIQQARKIQLNALYGAQANQFFRFYDDRIAEGITLTGQYIIKRVGQALNDYLNKILDTTGVDYSFYSDTDSCYITLDALVKKFVKPDTPKEKIVDILNKVCEDKIVKAINEACEDLAAYTNAFERKIVFKREVIADRAVWVAKKRYALNVYDSEGVRYENPKLKVTGLEIVRSSTPAPVREHLKEAVKICLTGTEAQVQKYLADFEKEYRQLAPEDIAFPRGVNGLAKYGSFTDIYTKGTPIHVRGSLLYNHHIKKMGLDKKYEEISEGDKIKFLYLKEPNPIGENAIAFLTKLPVEMDLDKYVDYNTMWQKSFVEPLKTILDCLRWHHEPQATLEDLFD
jgi:DNA polymerase elongation subunit (family B)